jgi:hypothetical protein
MLVLTIQVVYNRGRVNKLFGFSRDTSRRQQQNPICVSGGVCVLTFLICLQLLVFRSGSNANREWQLHNTVRRYK